MSEQRQSLEYQPNYNQIQFQMNQQEDTTEDLEKVATLLETSNLLKRVREHLKSGRTSKVDSQLWNLKKIIH